MAKAYLKEEPKFTPVILEIQTKEEFDFLYGLTNASATKLKGNCRNYNKELDDKFFEQLDNIQNKFDSQNFTM